MAAPNKDDEYTFKFKLSQKQRDFVESTATFSFYVGGVGAGKALALDTPVPTPTGWTTMGELRLGGEVFDEAGRTCRVTFMTPVMRDHACYEVEFSDGSTIVADAEHRWYVESHKDRCARRSGKVLTTEQIAAKARIHGGNQTNYAIPLARPLDLPDADLPVDPYVFGCWLGDGTATTAQITSIDAPILDEIRAAGYGVNAVRVSGDRTPQYTMGSRPPLRSVETGRMLPNGSLRSTLRAMGVLGNKHIPPAYLRASEAQRLALLQGLMDTDGHCDKLGKCSFVTKYRALADQFRELCASLSIKTSLTSKTIHKAGRELGPYWTISLTPRVPVFRLMRKAARQRFKIQSPSRGYLFITGVHPCPSVPVRCIQVDSPNHLFLVGHSMVPTHNTFAGSVRSILFSAKYPGCLGLIGAPTYPMLRDTTQRTFFELCPPKLIKSYNKNEALLTLNTNPESEILFRSMDDPDKLRGLNLCWFWLDEAPFCGYYAWKVLKARAGRQKGFPRAGWATGTPKGKDGYYDDFERDPKPSHFLVRTATYENAANLPEDYAESLGYEGAFRQQEIEGQFTAYEGLVYNFAAEPAPQGHEIPKGWAFRLPSGKYLVENARGDAYRTTIAKPENAARVVNLRRTIAGVDWGFANPAACLAVGIDEDGRHYQLSEFYQAKLPLQNGFIPAIVDMMRKFECDYVFCDPAEPENILDLTHALDDANVQCAAKAGDNAIFNGINTVRKFLRRWDDGMCGLLVAPFCHNTIREFSQYQYTEKNEDKRNPREVPDDKFNHAVSALRYLLHTAHGIGRELDIAAAGSRTPGGGDIEDAERDLKKEDSELAIVRGQAAADVLRALRDFGLADRDQTLDAWAGLHRPWDF